MTHSHANVATAAALSAAFPPHPKRLSAPHAEPPSNDHTGGVIPPTPLCHQHSRTAITKTLIPLVMTVSWPQTSSRAVSQFAVDYTTATTHKLRYRRQSSHPSTGQPATVASATTLAGHQSQKSCAEMHMAFYQSL